MKLLRDEAVKALQYANGELQNYVSLYGSEVPLSLVMLLSDLDHVVNNTVGRDDEWYQRERKQTDRYPAKHYKYWKRGSVNNVTDEY